jgi:hypothetical protein
MFNSSNPTYVTIQRPGYYLVDFQMNGSITVSLATSGDVATRLLTGGTPPSAQIDNTLDYTEFPQLAVGLTYQVGLHSTMVRKFTKGQTTGAQIINDFGGGGPTFSMNLARFSVIQMAM